MKCENQTLNVLQFKINLLFSICVLFYSSFVCIPAYAITEAAGNAAGTAGATMLRVGATANVTTERLRCRPTGIVCTTCLMPDPLHVRSTRGTVDSRWSGHPISHHCFGVDAW